MEPRLKYNYEHISVWSESLLQSSTTWLRPNSITLSGSKLVRSWSHTDSKLVGDQLRTCLRPASNQIA